MKYQYLFQTFLNDTVKTTILYDHMRFPAPCPTFIFPEILLIFSHNIDLLLFFITFSRHQIRTTHLENIVFNCSLP